VSILTHPARRKDSASDISTVPSGPTFRRSRFVQIRGEPRCCVGQVDETVLDHCSLRVHALGEAKRRLTRQALPLVTPRAHDLVGLRLIAVTAYMPSRISSWINWVPEALSSISTTLGRSRPYCSRTARSAISTDPDAEHHRSVSGYLPSGQRRADL